MTDLAVVIVTWNVRDLVLDALRSLFDDLTSSGLNADVYVIDGASSDGTANAVAEAFPQVQLTPSTENLGFVKANNLGLRQIGFGSKPIQDLPKAVYLLNPDTITKPGATRTLYDTLISNPTYGLVGAGLEYGDGRFQDGAFAFPGLKQLWIEFFPTPGRLIESSFNGRYPRALYDTGTPFPVDFVLGATMMLRREVVETVGLLDEQFFMYCEEIDWAWRIRDAGWEVYCVPAARVVHLAGQSTAQVPPQTIVRLWTSRLQLFAKHYPRWKNAVARWMVRLGMQRKIRLAQQTNHTPETDAILASYRTVYERASR